MCHSSPDATTRPAKAMKVSVQPGRISEACTSGAIRVLLLPGSRHGPDGWSRRATTSYATNVDVDRDPNLLVHTKRFSRSDTMSTGRGTCATTSSPRDQGVNLVSFSGNASVLAGSPRGGRGGRPAGPHAGGIQGTLDARIRSRPTISRPINSDWRRQSSPRTPMIGVRFVTAGADRARRRGRVALRCSRGPAEERRPADERRWFDVYWLRSRCDGSELAGQRPASGALAGHAGCRVFCRYHHRIGRRAARRCSPRKHWMVADGSSGRADDAQRARAVHDRQRLCMTRHRRGPFFRSRFSAQDIGDVGRPGFVSAGRSGIASRSTAAGREMSAHRRCDVTTRIRCCRATDRSRRG